MAFKMPSQLFFFFIILFKELFLMRQLKMCPNYIDFLNIFLVFFSNSFENKLWVL